MEKKRFRSVGDCCEFLWCFVLWSYWASLLLCLAALLCFVSHSYLYIFLSLPSFLPSSLIHLILIINIYIYICFIILSNWLLSLVFCTFIFYSTLTILIPYIRCVYSSRMHSMIFQPYKLTLLSLWVCLLLACLYIVSAKFSQHERVKSCLISVTFLSLFYFIKTIICYDNDVSMVVWFNVPLSRFT